MNAPDYINLSAVRDSSDAIAKVKLTNAVLMVTTSCATQNVTAVWRALISVLFSISIIMRK